MKFFGPFRNLRFSDSEILNQLEYHEEDTSKVPPGRVLYEGTIKNPIDEARSFLTDRCGYTKKEAEKLIQKARWKEKKRNGLHGQDQKDD